MDTPPIAEKVKFWEEQDRINQELIPRVIKLHEVLTTHVEGHDSATTQIAALEARLAGRERSLRSMRLQTFAISGLSLVIAVISIGLALAP